MFSQSQKMKTPNGSRHQSPHTKAFPGTSCPDESCFFFFFYVWNQSLHFVCYLFLTLVSQTSCTGNCLPSRWLSLLPIMVHLFPQLGVTFPSVHIILTVLLISRLFCFTKSLHYYAVLHLQHGIKLPYALKGFFFFCS